jgi:hypothetical protein
MRVLGRPPSWRMAVNVDEGLNFALYVRDGCGLAVHGGRLPGHLAAPVPDLGARLTDQQRAAAARDWPGWWARLVEDRRRVSGEVAPVPPVPPALVDPEAFGSLAERPALQAACRLAWRPFQDWWSGPRPRLGRAPLGPTGAKARLVAELMAASGDTGQVVRAVERERRRRARPFAFAVDLVAVEGGGVWRVSEGYAVVAAGLLGDRAGYLAWLHQVVSELA